VLGALSAVVERSAGAFNPQELANTLWAYATLGEAPSASVLGALSAVVERSAGAFKPQDVANTLWAYATLQIEPPSPLFSRATELSARSFCDIGLSQICYTHLVGQALGWAFNPPDELLKRAQATMRAQATKVTVSATQRRVHTALESMGLQPQLEALTDDGLFSIDIALPAKVGESLRIAVEVDGPQHFTSSGCKTGNTRLRDYLLERRGWRLVSLRVADIDKARSSAELCQYLADALIEL